MALRKIRSPSLSERLHRQKRSRRLRLGLLFLAALSSPFWGWPAAKWGVSRVATSLTNYRVRSFRVIGTEQVSARKLIEISGIAEGTPLFQVSLKSAAERIRTYPWIRTAILLRRLPDTIELRVEERRPVALINAQRLWMVTADSVLLPVGDSAQAWDLPLLSVSRVPPHAAGDRLRDAQACSLLAQSCSARKHAPRVWADLSELFWREDEMWAIFQRGNAELRLGTGAGEIGWKSLDKLLDQLQAQHRLADVKSIDLRFIGRIAIAYAEGQYTNLKPFKGDERAQQSL